MEFFLLYQWNKKEKRNRLISKYSIIIIWLQVTHFYDQEVEWWKHTHIRFLGIYLNTLNSGPKEVHLSFSGFW